MCLSVQCSCLSNITELFFWVGFGFVFFLSLNNTVYKDAVPSYSLERHALSLFKSWECFKILLRRCLPSTLIVNIFSCFHMEREIQGQHLVKRVLNDISRWAFSESETHLNSLCFETSVNERVSP